MTQVTFRIEFPIRNPPPTKCLSMRKICFLIACLISLQQIVFGKSPDTGNFTFSVDAPTFTVSFTNISTLGDEPGDRKAFWNFGDGKRETTGALHNIQHPYSVAGSYSVCLRIFRYRSHLDSVLTVEVCKTVIIEPSCGVDFERMPGASVNNPLRTEFKAQPFSNTHKKPSKICWIFGDGRDTCINYPENYTGVYAVAHTYAHNGQYEMCVKVLYYGGCEARKCRLVSIVTPDNCSAGFIRQPGGSINNPLRTEFKALPLHNNNKKPSRICWTFGDGHDACINYSETYSGGYTVSHTYATAGEYKVCEKIIYFGGCEKSVCKEFRVPDKYEPHLILTPNPVHNEVHALYYSTFSGPVTIRIINANIQVRSYTRTAIAGINNWEFNLGILTPGIYTFIVQSPNQAVRVMFLKI